MNSTTSENIESHNHRHDPNRFAVIPTPQRLQAGTERTGKGVTIAFIDSGFYPHADLTKPLNRILAYVDVSKPDSQDLQQLDAEPHDWDWHGTQISIAAAGNEHLSDGVYRGLASDARVVLIKASDRGKIPEANIARGIKWAIANKERYNIRIISISLGGDEDVSYEQNEVDQAAEEAIRQGIIVVAAAGNSGCTDRHLTVPPANSPSVITVGGYDDKNRLNSRDLELYCSSFGLTADGIFKPEIIAPAMWVAAPILPGTALYRQAEALSRLANATDYELPNLAKELRHEARLPEALMANSPDSIRAAVETMLRDNKIVATHYQHVDGTSFAAPIVASIIALMLEANPNLSPSLVKQILIATADRISNRPVGRQGYGAVNAKRAIEAARREQHVHQSNHFMPPRVAGGKLIFLYIIMTKHTRFIWPAISTAGTPTKRASSGKQMEFGGRIFLLRRPDAIITDSSSMASAGSTIRATA